MTDLRLTCLVPGCTHTRGKRKGEQPIRDSEEWVCGDHWRLVPRRLKTVLTRARRRWLKADARFNAIYDANFAGRSAVGYDEAYAAAVFYNSAARRLWRRVRREAIERGLGL